MNCFVAEMIWSLFFILLHGLSRRRLLNQVNQGNCNSIHDCLEYITSVSLAFVIDDFIPVTVMSPCWAPRWVRSTGDETIPN